MFKKIFFGLALAAGLTACTDDYTDWADPMANGPEGTKATTLAVSNVEAIDLAQVTGDSVQLFKTDVTATDASYSTTYDVTLSGEGASQTTELRADNQCRVAVADLTEAIVSMYGRRPTQRVLNAAIKAYINVNGQAMLHEGNTTVRATLTAPVIEEAYYLIGQQNGWNPATVTDWKFNHSGADVYDDPVFTISVPAPVGDNGERVDFWFNIVPASQVAPLQGGDWSQLIGSDIGNGDDRREAGLSVKVNGADNAFVQYASDGAKVYNITLNMLDGKMTIEALSFEEFIYMPGNPKWNPETAPALRSANFDGVYTGFAYIDGDFKFTKHRNWNDGEYNYNSFSSLPENFTQGDGSNLKCTVTGFYQLTANVANGTLSATRIEKWGLIGDATTGGWNEDTDMSWNAEEGCWQVVATMGDGTFKFRANGDWGINLGGSTNDLTQDGANLDVKAGTYLVKLFVERTDNNALYCTLTPQ
ncbi:MAG: DUF5115 domain-containing protein [Alloprevotella sp.]